MQNNLKKFGSLISLGKYNEAQTLLTAHREDIVLYFPENHPAYLSVNNNQALLLKLAGNFAESKLIFEIVVKQYGEHYGEMHPSTVNALINLGTVMKDLHLYEEAIIVLEKAINGRRENEGEDSINLAMTKAMAAGAYRDAGKFE